MTIRQWVFFFLFFGTLIPGSASTPGISSGKDSLEFFDARKFDVIGRYHDEHNFVRLPEKYKDKVRESVWSLSRNSAGIAIRFRTNSPIIVVRCTVMNDANLPHMPATGVKGVDLYAFNGSEWQYIKTGFPRGKVSEYVLLSDGDGVAREYLLNLPLYDGVESLEISVKPGTEIGKAKDRLLLEKKPVVYYGTSIAQGGCASRPGLAYTNILSRKLDRPFINLGFSGNGTIETSVGEAMAEVDAALYVIDCNPNTKDDVIYERTIALVRMLKERRPAIPILLVEGFLNESNFFNPASGGNENIRKKRAELFRAYESLKKAGTTKIAYLKGDGLIGKDHEATVDGIHPNDIGMMRMAEALMPAIKKFCKN
ncbi:MAG TPA: SGNH/GDSL hydrolase family protein [Chryseosolibacter sp.]